MNKKQKNEEEIIYQVIGDRYQVAKDTGAKCIEHDDKNVYLSLFSHVLDYNDKCTFSLGIRVLEDGDNQKILTTVIPQLDSFKNKVAINPDFDDDKLIEKLRKLNIISDVLEKVNHDDIEYKIVTVDIENLKSYCPSDTALLSSYKTIDENNNDKYER